MPPKQFERVNPAAADAAFQSYLQYRKSSSPMMTPSPVAGVPVLVRRAPSPPVEYVTDRRIERIDKSRMPDYLQAIYARSASLQTPTPRASSRRRSSRPSMRRIEERYSTPVRQAYSSRLLRAVRESSDAGPIEQLFGPYEYTGQRLGRKRRPDVSIGSTPLTRKGLWDLSVDQLRAKAKQKGVHIPSKKRLKKDIIALLWNAMTKK